MQILLLLLTVAVPAPKFPDRVPVPKFVEVEVEVSAVAAPGVPTADELAAIDRRFWETHHWELCPGSCGMLCKDYHPAWKIVPGAPPAAGAESSPKDTGNAREANSANPAGGCPGCPGGRCGVGLFRRRR
jgi:hypothetical protein